MSPPSGTDYSGAVQNPHIAFTDQDLRRCQVEFVLWRPKVYSGGFTATFRLQDHTRAWAVRCFVRDVPDLQKRYEAITRFLETTPPYSPFVKTFYLPQGIKVKGNWYPVIKMEWVDGEPLNTYISRRVNDYAAVRELLSRFCDLIRYLERLGIAHGDLQHGNILVQNGKLYLVDYDGMYLPEIAQLGSNNTGHVNYQSPYRSAHYGPYLDRFSAIVIYLALQALSVEPRLWSKYDDGDNILFRGEDFIHVERSALLSELASIPALSRQVEWFKRICALDPERVPSLDQFVAGEWEEQAPSRRRKPSRVRLQYPLLDAAQKEILLKHVGLRVEVIGQVSQAHRGRTQYRDPYLFLNFGEYPHQTFTLVFWSEALSEFERSGRSPESFVYEWIRAIGVISCYEDRPEMIIETLSQIQVLSEEEARERLSQVEDFETMVNRQLEENEDEEEDLEQTVDMRGPVQAPSKRGTPPDSGKPMQPSPTDGVLKRHEADALNTLYGAHRQVRKK